MSDMSPGYPGDVQYRGPKPARSRAAFWLAIAATTLLTALTVESTLFLVASVRREEVLAKQHNAERLEAKEEHLAELKKNEARRVPYSTMKHGCYATNAEVTCSVTNLSDVPVTACMQGLLAQKQSSGVRLYSIPMCTGTVAPLSTKAIAVPWGQGHAADICRGANNFLDWDKCDFDVIDFNPPTTAPVAANAGTQ